MMVHVLHVHQIQYPLLDQLNVIHVNQVLNHHHHHFAVDAHQELSLLMVDHVSTVQVVIMHLNQLQYIALNVPRV